MSLDYYLSDNFHNNKYTKLFFNGERKTEHLIYTKKSID